MNFLAHLFLSEHDDFLLVGNFLADFLRKEELDAMDPRIVDGVMLHRRIDHFTDNHPQVRQSIRRLYPYHRKYASVLVDIFYDYFLARNWSSFHSCPLPDFTRAIYQRLLDRRDLMPARLAERTGLMVADNWLMLYTHAEGLTRTFQRLRNRLSRPEWIDDAVSTLHRFETDMDREFRAFFPEVIQMIEDEDGNSSLTKY